MKASDKKAISDWVKRNRTMSCPFCSYPCFKDKRHKGVYKHGEKWPYCERTDERTIEERLRSNLDTVLDFYEAAITENAELKERIEKAIGNLKE